MHPMKIHLFRAAAATSAAAVFFSVEARGRPDQPGLGDRPPHHWPTFDELDGNHDGKVERDEYTARQEKVVQERFRRVDHDGDGQIDQHELAGAAHRLADSSPDFAARIKRRSADFAAMDKDGSGGLSRDEFNEILVDTSQERFDRIDRNDDGLITRDELDAAIQALDEKPAKPERKRDRTRARDARPGT